MKMFKRINAPLIEAWHWDGYADTMMNCPTEISGFVHSPSGSHAFEVETSGSVKAKLTLGNPMWLVLEQDGRGAYPMSGSYMENNFEELSAT